MPVFRVGEEPEFDTGRPVSRTQSSPAERFQLVQRRTVDVGPPASRVHSSPTERTADAGPPASRVKTASKQRTIDSYTNDCTAEAMYTSGGIQVPFHRTTTLEEWVQSGEINVQFELAGRTVTGVEAASYLDAQVQQATMHEVAPIVHATVDGAAPEAPVEQVAPIVHATVDGAAPETSAEVAHFEHAAAGPMQAVAVEEVEVAEQFIKEIKDGFAIYSNDVRIVKPVPGESILYQTFRDLFGADASNLAKSHIILVEYKNTGSDETNALEMVKERLQTLDILYDATVVCGCVSVLIFKSNYMAIRQQLNIHDLTPPLVYRLINPKSIGSQAARQKQLDAFVARSKLPSERVCTMHLKNGVNPKPGFLSVFKEFLDENAHAIQAMSASDRAGVRRMAADMFA